jgi:hypothetical protein
MMAARTTRFCRYCGRINGPLRPTLLPDYSVCLKGCRAEPSSLEHTANEFIERSPRGTLRAQLETAEALIVDLADALARSREAGQMP